MVHSSRFICFYQSHVSVLVVVFSPVAIRDRNCTIDTHICCGTEHCIALLFCFVSASLGHCSVTH